MESDTDSCGPRQCKFDVNYNLINYGCYGPQRISSDRILNEV